MLTALISVWLLHLLAVTLPGANTFLVMRSAASRQFSYGIRAAFGIAIGSAGWATLAVLGVSAVFIAFPMVRLALQIAGGLYLCWLCFSFWSSSGAKASAGADTDTGTSAFRLGLLTNFTNPKAALFFGSIFSAALPTQPPAWLLLAAVLAVFANALGWYSLVAYLFSRNSVRRAYAANATMVSRAVGLVLGAFGARLLYLTYREAAA
jgi:threonine efflux protein